MKNIHHQLTTMGVCTVVNSDKLPIETIRRYKTRGLVNNFLFNKATDSFQFSSVTLLIDHHNSDIGNENVDGETHLLISDQFSNNNMLNAPIKIKAGTTVLIKVTPFSIKAADRLRYLKPQKRGENGCFLRDETSEPEGIMFKEYKKVNCLLECKLNHVIKEIGCAPWDVDIPVEEGTKNPPICLFKQTKAFRHAFLSLNEDDHCLHCRDDCELTTYSYHADTRLTNPIEECSYNDVFHILQSRHKRQSYQFDLSIEKEYLVGNQVDLYFCHQKLVKDVTILHVTIDDPPLAGIKMDRALHLYDALTNIGGTLGLFNGFSFIALLEILFLILTNVKQTNADELHGFTRFLHALSLHGVQYIEHRFIQKLLWTVTLLIFWAIGISSVINSFKENIKEPFLFDSFLGNHSRDVAYPAVTFCANQFYDRWSLQRLLWDMEGLAISEFSDAYEDFGNFAREFAQFPWLSKQYVSNLPCSVKNQIAILVNHTERYEINDAICKEISPGSGEHCFQLPKMKIDALVNLTLSLIFPKLGVQSTCKIFIDNINFDCFTSPGVDYHIKYGQMFVSVLQSTENTTNDNSQCVGNFDDLLEARETETIIAAQILDLYKHMDPVEDFGSLLSIFAEFVIEYSFHPKLHFEENMQIYAPYEHLQDLLFNRSTEYIDGIFGDIGVPLVEFPPLIEPFHASRTDQRPLSMREKATRRVYYAHYYNWRAYLIKEHSEKPLSLQSEQNVYPAEKLKPIQDFLGENTQVYGFVLTLEKDFYNAKEDPLLNGKVVKSQTGTDATDYTQLGLDRIQEWYETNSFGKSINSNKEALNIIMKMSIVLGNLRENFDFDQIADLQPSLRLQDLTKDQMNDIFENGIDRLELIRECKAFGRTTEDCKHQFVHAITTRGLCTALNIAPQHTTFPTAPNFEELAEAYVLSSLNAPLTAVELGVDLGLELILDVHQMDVYGSERGSVTIALNSFHDAFDMTNGFLNVFPGYSVHLFVKVQELRTETSVGPLDFQKQSDCNFQGSENKAHNVGYYTKKACKFARAISLATEEFKCVPWDHLRFQEGGDVPVCMRDKVLDFQNKVYSHMQNDTGCPSECDGFSYFFQTNVFKFDPFAKVRFVFFYDITL